MAEVTLQGNKVHTLGDLPSVGQKAPDFTLIGTDLSEKSLNDFSGKIILNIFTSLDTGTCATSVRTFNKEVSSLDNTTVLCISRDLPFAHGRFCSTEGIENAINLSDFRDCDFGKAYNLCLVDGPTKGLLSRVVIVLDENKNVVYTEQVPELVNEPNYEAAIEAVKNI